MIITITGGSGFIGTAITKKLIELGHRVIILDRNPPRIQHSLVEYIATDFSEGTVPDRVVDVDAIIHLAGTSIFKRWTPEYKKLILSSRTRPIQELLDISRRTGKAPRAFVSASAIGWYGYGVEAVDESFAAGTGFLSQVCSQWEAEATSFESVQSRVISVRTAIVLGPGGGMMSQVVPVFKWGIGGTFGSGEQWFSWIHVDDLVSVYIQAVTDESLSGSVNAASPNPVTNKQFVRALGRTLHRPSFLRIPGWALRIVLGEFAGAVLGSQRVIPKKLIDAGFSFTYPTIERALEKSLRA
jgi:uncharacterized protein